MGRHGTIAGRKEKQDSRRAAMFTKYARAITVAAKGGGDPEYNIALKHAIEKAKGINMPNENIKRAVKKGTGELDGETYETGSFEGYGAAGVAVVIDVLTDNKKQDDFKCKARLRQVRRQSRNTGLRVVHVRKKRCNSY